MLIVTGPRDDRADRGTSATTSARIDYRDIPRRMKLEYTHPAASRGDKILGLVGNLLDSLQNSRIDNRTFINDAANIIAKAFSLRTVAIGLRGRDGLYRYDTLVGYTPEAETVARKTAYTYDQFTDNDTYKGTKISKYTEILLAEDHPWTEEERNAYARPSLIGMKRRALDDYVEGDYIDTYILDSDGVPLGWIEVGGTTVGKLPSATAIKWIELIARVLAISITSNSGNRRISRT